MADGEDRQKDRGMGDSLAAPGLLRLPRAARARGRSVAALAAALGLHVVAIGGVLVVFDLPLGHRGAETDVVEVSLVPSDALRGETAGTSSVASGGHSLGEQPGAGAEADAVVGLTTPPQAEAPPDAQSAEPHRLALPVTLEGEDAAVGPRSAMQAAAPARSDGDSDVSAVAGGAATIAAAPASDTTAATVASDGEVNAYNQRVAVTLSKLKPKGVGEAGLARVVFRISSSGAVDDVKLASSTGKSKLDRLATETVARAKFDTPPAGMTTAQLTYAVAFRFR